MALTVSAPVVLVCCLLLELAGGKDLYWQPNSNWGSSANWALGRVPACNDRVSLASVPDNTVIYLDTDTTVQSISLPKNGRLVLSPSVTIRLSAEEDCTVPGDVEPMAATVQENEFVGAGVDYWECSSNWATKDNFPADHAPCGSDRAFFDEGAFSFVKANDSIFVRSLTIRGAELQTSSELTSSEFDLNIQINSGCATDPSQCPCPDDSKCPKPPGPPVVDGQGGKSKSEGGSNSGAIAGGVVFGILVVVAVVLVLVIVGAFWYFRRRSQTSYMKEELIDDSEIGTSSSPPPPASSTNMFDNPVYDDEVKVDLGSEMSKIPPVGDVPAAEVNVNVYDNAILYPPDDEDEKKAPKLNEYERL